MLVKVNFEKACGNVSSNYLRYVLKRTGFCPNWMRWMEAVVFTSSLSVLVNDNPTMDFLACRGLCQGDSMSPFIFLLAVGELVHLIQNVIILGEFQGFKVTEGNHFKLLYFANDTILVCNRSWKNSWSIKEFLRGFKLASGLRFNLFNSKLFCINVNEDFLQVVASFLSCASIISPSSSYGSPLEKILEEKQLGMWFFLSP